MAAFKVRRAAKFMQQTRYGDASNYTQMSASGTQTMAGSARVYKDIWIPATQWYGVEPNGFANAFVATAVASGSTPTVVPLQVYGGEHGASPILLPVLTGSAAENLDIRAATAFIAPTDSDESASPTATLYWAMPSVNGTTGSMVVWRLHWNYYGTGGSKFGGRSGSLLYGASMASTGSNVLEVSALGSIGTFVAASPFCVFQITEEGSNASQMAASAGESVIGLRIRYVVNSLGIGV